VQGFKPVFVTKKAPCTEITKLNYSLLHKLIEGLAKLSFTQSLCYQDFENLSPAAIGSMALKSLWP